LLKSTSETLRFHTASTRNGHSNRDRGAGEWAHAAASCGRGRIDCPIRPEIAAKLAAQGIDVRTGTPQAAQQFIENQIDVWAKVVKDNNIKAD